MFCPGVLQIHPTGLMCPSPRHLIFLLCSLLYLLFRLCIFLNIGFPSFPIAVLLYPLYHLHRLGVFKLGFVQSLKFCILRAIAFHTFFRLHVQTCLFCGIPLWRCPGALPICHTPNRNIISPKSPVLLFQIRSS